MSNPILSWLIFLPALGALAVLMLPNRWRWIRQTAFITTSGTFLLSVYAAWMFDWNVAPGSAAGAAYGSQIQFSTNLPWIASLNVHYFVGVDGLSMPFILLTTAMSLLACVASFGIDKQLKGYFAFFLFLESALLGAFVALDLFLFYLFFELSLVPLFFLIGIWGGQRRANAAIKFFLFSLLGSVALLAVISGISHYTAVHGLLVTSGTPAETGPCFDLIRLTSPDINASFTSGDAAKFSITAFWLMLGGFAVKLPIVPLHTWLPDALAEAPAPIGMMLAAVVLKLGGYALLRVAFPLFAHEAAVHWRWVALIGAAGIVYGALCALAQRDLRRLIAHWSISQMGYVILGLAVLTPMAANGAVFHMIGHGITAALLLFAAGVITDRAHHADISRLGGLWSQMPTYAGWTLIGFFAALGLPGLCGFIGQFLVLVGVFSAAGSESTIVNGGGAPVQSVITFAVMAAAAIVLTAGCIVWTVQRVYMGKPKPEFSHFAPLRAKEKLILAVLGLAAIAWGIFPNQLLLGPIRATMDGLMRLIRAGA